MAKENFRHKTIALVYDFDGTLTPQPMQEYTILPELKIKPAKFWSEVKESARINKAEEIVTYMRIMLEKANAAHFSIKKRNLKKLASKIQFFPGVDGRNNFFQRVNRYVHKKSDGMVKVQHYLLSAGLKEILSGIPIKNEFQNIFASEYFYDHNGVATFPNVIVNDTVKTQFLFRINKGKENINDSINSHMEWKDRVIPFENILYLGDGLTDVPCMTVLMKENGYAIAVYRTGTSKGLSTCEKLHDAGRVDFFAPADYRKGSKLSKYVEIILDNMMGNIGYLNASFKIASEIRASKRKKKNV